jgi:hypothetical protein
MLLLMIRPATTTLAEVPLADLSFLPGVFAAGLKRWLAMFHVHYMPKVPDAIVELGKSGRRTVEFESVARRYAYIASIEKN